MTWDPIADTPAALTPEWVTGALHAGGRFDSAVTSVHQEIVGTGQMSDSVRLTLTYASADGGPPTLIAKLPAADPTSRATALALRSYENEVRFYQQLAPQLPIRTPDVYYADIEVATARFVLLLEDMAPARQGDQLQGCTADMARVAVDELVHLHAPRWADPSLATLEWLHRDRDAQQQFLMVLLPSLWDGFRQRYAAELGADVHVAGEALFGRLGEYLSADSEPWTVVHGDYRLDNLLFDPTPGGVALTVVDWQTCGRGPALNDVAYFIGAGLLPDTRAEIEEELVRDYHRGLVATGVERYDWNRCWRDYRRGTWAGLIMAVAASMLVERTPRGDEMFLTMAARHSRHALDLAATELLTV